MLELVDKEVSKTSGRKSVWVRLPPSPLLRPSLRSGLRSANTTDEFEIAPKKLIKANECPPKLCAKEDISPFVIKPMINFFKKNKKEPKSSKEILESLDKLNKYIKDVNQRLEDFKKQSRTALQKIGIVRFNPFKDAGGNQSFSIAMLDADNNGFVLTSYYGRELNRTYLKPVKSGRPKYSLSEEEEEALSRAVGS